MHLRTEFDQLDVNGMIESSAVQVSNVPSIIRGDRHLDHGVASILSAKDGRSTPQYDMGIQVIVWVDQIKEIEVGRYYGRLADFVARSPPSYLVC